MRWQLDYTGGVKPMTSPTTTTNGSPAPPGEHGTAQERKAQVARQLAALFALARAWWRAKGEWPR
jgi:hypothetical protein